MRVGGWFFGGGKVENFGLGVLAFLSGAGHFGFSVGGLSLPCCQVSLILTNFLFFFLDALGVSSRLWARVAEAEMTVRRWRAWVFFIQTYLFSNILSYSHLILSCLVWRYLRGRD